MYCMFAFCIHYVHIFLCAVGLHVSVHKWLLHVASNVYLMWPGPVVCLGITASDPCQCAWIVSTWGFYPSSWPRGSLPFQTVCWAIPTALLRFSYSTHGMCYSSHVVMSCQKQPWQMLLFCLWNDHVGLTLQTTIIIHSWLLCTCKISFVGMKCRNSKAGGHFICKVNEIQHSSLCASAVKKKNLRKQQDRHECN